MYKCSEWAVTAHQLQSFIILFWIWFFKMISSMVSSSSSWRSCSQWYIRWRGGNKAVLFYTSFLICIGYSQYVSLQTHTTPLNSVLPSNYVSFISFFLPLFYYKIDFNSHLCTQWLCQKKNRRTIFANFQIQGQASAVAKPKLYVWWQGNPEPQKRRIVTNKIIINTNKRKTMAWPGADLMSSWHRVGIGFTQRKPTSYGQMRHDTNLEMSFTTGRFRQGNIYCGSFNGALVEDAKWSV